LSLPAFAGFGKMGVMQTACNVGWSFGGEMRISTRFQKYYSRENASNKD
jgi:hypothetical protein